MLMEAHLERNRTFSREKIVEGLDNVLRLGRPAPDAGREATRSVRIKRDWVSALDSVNQAAEVLRASENHAKEVEARGVALAERALQELKLAESRVQAAQAAERAAEARAEEAEARAKEAEDWLLRLQDAIHENLLIRPAAPAHRTSAAA
jgi:hypothetical protein